MDTVKKYLPKATQDRLAFGFTVTMIHVICLFELVVILPYIDSDHEQHKDRMPMFWVHFALGLFLYINVIGSFVKCIVTDSTSGSVILPSILKPGWKFCSYCESNAPPRSFHCWTCRKCVLKRDHHCMFTGNCIGYYNLRYFMSMVLYLSIGAAYCNYLNMDYVLEIVGGLTPISIFTMIMPLFSWMLGFAASFTFSVAFLSSTCLIGFLLLVALFGYHMLNNINGQTTFERSHGIKLYNYGFIGNMKEVFGENWLLAMLCPFASSPFPGNGIEFPDKYKIENVKNM